jgi:hypothetical protein
MHTFWYDPAKKESIICARLRGNFDENTWHIYAYGKRIVSRLIVVTVVGE